MLCAAVISSIFAFRKNVSGKCGGNRIKKMPFPTGRAFFIAVELGLLVLNTVLQTA